MYQKFQALTVHAVSAFFVLGTKKVTQSVEFGEIGLDCCAMDSL